MGKGRKQQHFDRNATVRFGVGCGGSSPIVVIERSRPAPPPAPATVSNALATAFPLPIRDEPLVLAHTPFELPSRSQSKYPAKKVKRIKSPQVSAPSLCSAMPTPVAQGEMVRRSLPQWIAPQPTHQLLLIYRPPLVSVPIPLLDFGCLLAFAREWEVPPVTQVASVPVDLLDRTLLAHFAPRFPFAVRAVRARVAVHKPLPRHAAIAPYRKPGLIAAMGAWLRGCGRRFAALVAPRDELSQLRAENIALKRQLRTLRTARA